MIDSSIQTQIQSDAGYRPSNLEPRAAVAELATKSDPSILTE